MKRIIVFVLFTLAGLLLEVAAEPITFQFQSATVNGVDYKKADGEWIYTNTLRIKFLPNGMPDTYDADQVGIFWGAMLTGYSAPVEYGFSLTGRICNAGACAITTFTGVLQATPLGLAWKLPPNSRTISLSDGSLLGLATATNVPGGNPIRTVHGTIDLAIKGIPSAPIPEPATLVLLGSGLAFAAKRFRKKA